MEVAGYYVVCMCSGSACENGIRARSRDCEYSSGLYQAGGSTLGLRLGPSPVEFNFLRVARTS